MVHALLRGIVIATIYNGIRLLAQSAATRYMVTALVLLVAVTVDAVARRGGGS
jgi:D-xylose transport system permease protein